ncbi:unnamed protein product [Bemisia tabaci]|uniref:Uncharacterized protein n=1 Tax=Bemisia tabaci TaxID=7038 RepID=A0A9P0C4N6_BEMTA|nr:unnamed protein product [Bemisia tabaci]
MRFFVSSYSPFKMFSITSFSSRTRKIVDAALDFNYNAVIFKDNNYDTSAYGSNDVPLDLSIRKKSPRSVPSSLNCPSPRKTKKALGLSNCVDHSPISASYLCDISYSFPKSRSVDSDELILYSSVGENDLFFPKSSEYMPVSCVSDAPIFESPIILPKSGVAPRVLFNSPAELASPQCVEISANLTENTRCGTSKMCDIHIVQSEVVNDPKLSVIEPISCAPDVDFFNNPDVSLNRTSPHDLLPVSDEIFTDFGLNSSDKNTPSSDVREHATDISACAEISSAGDVNTSQSETVRNPEPPVVSVCAPNEVAVTIFGNPRKRGARRKLSKEEVANAKQQSLKEKHPVLPGCDDSCRRKCSDHVPEEKREEINLNFWDLDWASRRSFILRLCERKDAHRRRYLNQQKQNTFKYHFVTENSVRYEVCKPFFSTTLGFKATNDRYVHDILVPTTPKGVIQPKVKDNRGKISPPNKVPSELIAAHVESYNPSISHYRREHAPNTRYRPSDVTITDMHKNFLQKNPENQISYELYRRTVRKMKISITVLGNEECEKCEEFRLHEHGSPESGVVIVMFVLPGKLI